ISVVGRVPAEMIREGDIHKFRREKGHISLESRCLFLLTLGLGGFRRGDSPSSSSDMADFSVRGDLGLSLITHKNATLAESRPVSLAGSTTKKMLFLSTVI
uniref:Uncharacterized protein n=1 Tax=Microcebus murinus TaxID=30608 RepID=A0A8C5Y684_MICMU